LAINDAPDTLHEVNEIKGLLRVDGGVIYSPTKSSLTELWNYCLIFAPTDWVLICNDDAVFKPGWLDHLEKQIASGKYWQVNLLHYGGMCLHKSMVLRLGWFDETFRGGGYEDIDWQLRIKESGIKGQIEQKHNWKFMDHHVTTTKKWRGLNNSQWISEKWGRAGNWKLPSYRKRPEVDWHPTYTKKYEQKFGLKSRIPEINKMVDSGKAIHP